MTELYAVLIYIMLFVGIVGFGMIAVTLSGFALYLLVIGVLYAMYPFVYILEKTRKWRLSRSS